MNIVAEVTIGQRLIDGEYLPVFYTLHYDDLINQYVFLGPICNERSSGDVIYYKEKREGVNELLKIAKKYGALLISHYRFRAPPYPELLCAMCGREDLHYDEVVRAIFVDPNDPDIVMNRLTDKWEDHPAGSYIGYNEGLDWNGQPVAWHVVERC